MRVDLTPEEALAMQLEVRGDCLEWTGCVTHNGYGTLNPQGQRWRAHRLAYTLWVGPIPDGLQVLHQCDNRRCCLPEHLWLGTNLANRLDSKAKGRTYKGPRGYARAKLDIADIPIIREMIADGVAMTDIGSMYGVTCGAIAAIRDHETWRRVP